MASQYPNGPLPPSGSRNVAQSGAPVTLRSPGQSAGSFQMVSNGSGISAASSASSGRSFVVLNQPSPPVSTNRSPDTNFVMNPMGSQQMSLTDVTLEQALEKVQDLQKENYDLREYLKENNEMMKKQYDTLAQWKARVIDNNEKSKEKFEESKQIILSLRNEKDELEKRLQQQNKAQPAPTGSQVTQLQTEIHRLKEENLVHIKKTHELKQKVAELSSVLSAKSSPETQGDMGMMGETVFVTRSDSFDGEMNKLQQERDEYIEKNNNLEDKVRQFKEHTDQLIHDCAELQKLKDQMQQENSALQDENLKLSQQLQNVLMQSRKQGKVPSATNTGDLGFESIAKSGYSIVNMETEAQCAVTERVEHSVVGVQTQFSQEKLAGGASATALPDVPAIQLQEEKSLVQSLKKQLAERDNVVKKLESDLQQRQSMIEHYQNQQRAQLAQLTQEHQRKETELVQQLDAIQSELQQAKSEQSITYTSDIQSLRSQVLTLINEVHESQDKLNAATQAVDERSKRISQLQQQLNETQKDTIQQRSEADQLVQSLQMSVVAGQEALSAERTEHQNTRKQTMELRASFNQLVNDYKELLDTFDEYKSQQAQQSVSPPGSDNKRLLEEINRLTAQTIAADDTIQFKNDQINELRMELARLKEETENIPILKAQAEVWKMDFDAERSARERQHTEKEKILEEMQNLQIQNQQLIDDLEGQSKKQMADMMRRHGTGGTYQQAMHHHLHVGSPQGPPGPHGYTTGQSSPENPNAGRGYPYPGPSPADQHAYGARGYPYPGHAQPQGHEENHRLGMPMDNNQTGGQPHSHTSEASQHDEGESHIFTCPKCELQCPDLDSLQIHVLECIDQPESTRPSGH